MDTPNSRSMGTTPAKGREWADKAVYPPNPLCVWKVCPIDCTFLHSSRVVFF